MKLDWVGWFALHEPQRSRPPRDWYPASWARTYGEALAVLEHRAPKGSLLAIMRRGAHPTDAVAPERCCPRECDQLEVERTCVVCEEVLVRRPKEQFFNFRTRLVCSARCRGLMRGPCRKNTAAHPWLADMRLARQEEVKHSGT